MGLEGLEFSAGIPGTMGGAICMNAGTKWGSYSDVVEEVTFFSSKNGYFNKKANELSFKYRGLGTRILDEETIVQKVTMRLKKSNGLDKSRALVDEILTYRGRRQPLEYPNCGSVFKNPPAPQRGAGRLIEACGLKGLTVGEAQISNKHANFILNLGNAKSSDVKELIEKAREQVLRKFSVNLEPEVKLL